MKRYVECVAQVFGVHCWPGADSLPEVSYLKYPHRHRFCIKVGFEVTHNERQVEINMTEEAVTSYLMRHYAKTSALCDFTGTSCESLAQEILDAFGAAFVEVTEDGFGGALLIK